MEISIWAGTGPKDRKREKIMAGCPEKNVFNFEVRVQINQKTPAQQ
jgi:hypothetical protein